jgi:thioesterase domain-containing protein
MNDFAGWDSLLSQDKIRVISVPGTHFSMMKSPHIETLGAALRIAMREQQATNKSASNVD